MIEGSAAGVNTLSAIVSVAAIGFGCMLTLCMQGYQFGRSNHTVYLLDAIRRTSPSLLEHDWFTTQTLQYHAAFGWLTRVLMGMGIVQSGFLVGYVALLILLHAAWWRLVALLGGGVGAFVISEVLFHVSAGGTGLGFYQFLQDGAFLPSNIAAVALLWGIVFWAEGRSVVAGIAFGVAGLFHLNYALVGIGLWTVLLLLDRRSIVGSVFAIIPSAVNIAFALRAAGEGSSMPLTQFVDLYVRLRHPHHYDPSSWPWWLWFSFVWTIPFCFLVRPKNARWRSIAICAAVFGGLIAVALIGAGVTYASEALVQASLYRFSVFLKLFSCVAAGLFLHKSLGKSATGLSTVLGIAVIALCLWRGPYAGFFRTPMDDAGYDGACDWIAKNTPADAIFLVPPSEEEFRLRARRAIVVNFKGCPQLSRELPQWRDRLQAVLDLPDLRHLPHPFEATRQAIRERYDALPPEHLERVARRYAARYILVSHRLPPAWDRREVVYDAKATWFLYDLNR